MTNKHYDLIKDLRENWMNDAIPTADTQNQVYQALRECGEEKFDTETHKCVVHLVSNNGELNMHDVYRTAGDALRDDKEVCVQVWVEKKPLPMPEDGKLYFVEGHELPLKYFACYKSVPCWWNGLRYIPDATPLRNPDNSLCECVVPNVKGGV